MTILNDVDLEKQEVTAYSATAAGLAEMRQRFNPALIPETVTDENYPLVKEAATTLQKLRTTLDKMRKEIKAPYLEASKLIDGEAKRLTLEIEKIEDPWRDAKAEYDEREKIREQKRQAKIQQVFDYLNTVKEQAYTMTSGELAEALEQLNNEPCVDAMERAPEALTLRNQIIDTVGQLYVQRAEQERMEAENRRLQAEQRINDVIARFSALVGNNMDADRATLEYQIADLEHGAMPDYGDRQPEVEAARDKALAGLRKLLAMLPEEEPEEPQQLGSPGEHIRAEEKANAERQIIEVNAPAELVSAIASLIMDQFAVRRIEGDESITKIWID